MSKSAPLGLIPACLLILIGILEFNDCNLKADKIYYMEFGNRFLYGGGRGWRNRREISPEETY
jgi:hypothetical protein